MKGWGKKVLHFWQQYSRPINLVSLAAGFCFDLYLAKRPDSLPDNILLLSYLALSAVIITLLNVRSRRAMERESPTEPLLLLLVLQFCFGGLASNLLILYGHSGTIGGSLFFVALLAGFALGNEFLKSRYAQLRFNIAVYYFLLLTYCVIAVPTFILHDIGWQAFLWSTAASAGVMAIFLAILLLSLSERDRVRNMYEIIGIVLGTLCVFNLLYWGNIIPPVPLSLKNIGVYHSLAALPQPDTSGAIYAASYEPSLWYIFWRDTSATYTFAPSDSRRAYCFSAVFAPGGLSTPIEHRWEEYDTTAKKWQTVSLVSFPINGGRTEGYRGYSVEENLSPGQWRCDVETDKGQLIGRISFDVVQSSATPALSTTAL